MGSYPAESSHPLSRLTLNDFSCLRGSIQPNLVTCVPHLPSPCDYPLIHFARRAADHLSDGAEWLQASVKSPGESYKSGSARDAGHKPVATLASRGPEADRPPACTPAAEIGASG